MNKLTILMAGKKQSGKSSTSNYILAKYLNYRLNRGSPFYVDDSGNLKLYAATDEEMRHLIDSKNGASVKVYSFADPLKDFCVNVLGVPHAGCWGTDAEKNAPIEHLRWENVLSELRPYERSEKTEGCLMPKEGPMTGREVMQLFGTGICRRLYHDCWARGTYSKIKQEGYELALVADARFPNEITMGTTVNAKSVRLGRDVSNDTHPSETALDNFPRHDYSLYIDNSKMTFKEQCEVLDPYLDQWFKETGII